MKMSDRSASKSLNFILVVGTLLLFSPGLAVANEEGHGNPGRFIENIRKGLSGLSRFFWSPRAQKPIEQKSDEPADRKSPESGAQKVIAAPKAGEKKPAKTKALAQKKAVGRARKEAPAFDKGDAGDRKDKSAFVMRQKNNAPQAKKKEALKAGTLEKPKSTNRADMAKAKPGSFSSRSSIKAKPAEQKNTKAKILSKPVAALPIKESAVSKLAKKNSQPEKSVKKTTGSAKAMVKPAKETTGKTVVAMATRQESEQRSPGQQFVYNDKGTYIWVPDRGSKLFQNFALTGISAYRMAENGDLDRTDGRWVFVPRRHGILPGIYGLSAQIQSAGSAGVWVGHDRNWVYVFDRKRDYASIVGRAAQKTASLSNKTKAKESASSQSGDNGKSQGKKLVEKTGVLQRHEPAKSKKSANLVSGKSETKTKDKGLNTARSGTIAQKKQKQLRKMTLASTAKAPAVHKKTEKSGNWSKIKGRWVYVPDKKMARGEKSGGTKLARRMKNAPGTGGWVRRNKVWVFVVPQQARAFARQTKKADAAHSLSAQHSAPGKQSMGMVSGARSGKTLAHQRQPIPLQSKTSRTKRGLAEGPDENVEDGNVQTTRHQGNWMRKNKRWVYANEKRVKTARLSSTSRTARNTGSVVTGAEARASVHEKDVRKQTARIPAREFFFFVPGQRPGTGDWFAAPFELLQKARKLKKPASAMR